MFCLFIGALILSQYVFYNYGQLCLWLIRIYSRIQMKLLTHQEKEEEEEEDGLECFVGKRIIKHITMNNAMDKINDSEFMVSSNFFISNSSFSMRFSPPPNFTWAKRCFSWVRSNLLWSSFLLKFMSILV